MLQGLKKRLDEAKEAWADELGTVLWSYQTTPQSTTSETLFKMTYGVETMIPMEVKEPSPSIIFQATSSYALWEEIDLTSEAREMAYMREKVLKQRIATRYNFVITTQKFEKGDLVL